MLKYFWTNEQTTPVDSQIDMVLDEMHRVGVSSEEYPKLMTSLERLYEIKANERRDPVSKDTLALIAGNLMGILLIVAYEQKHVMTSKGFNHLIRPRGT